MIALFLATALATCDCGDPEEFVGRMFAAAVSGDAEARKLFLTMKVSGHVGEIWSYAKANLELLGRP